MASAVINAMRLAEEGDHDIACGGLIQNDLRMAGGDNLAVLLGGKLGEKLVNLSLPENFEMGIGFI